MHPRARTTLKALIIALTFAAVAALIPARGSADDMSISREDWQKVMDRIEALTEQNRALNSRIQALESDKPVPDAAALTERIEALEKKDHLPGDSDIALLRDDVDHLSQILEVVERKTLVDTIEWGAELRTRADWYNYRFRYTKVGPLGRSRGTSRNSDKVQALISNRFRLNLKSTIGDNMQFHGRLTMHKHWNDYSYKTPSPSNEGRTPTDSSLFVERAYIDYFFELHEKLPMALTFGRLPMADGLPTNLRDDRPRQSTFPSLAYDMIADGAGLSIMLDKLTGLNKAAFRYVYMRRVTDDNAYPYLKYDLNIKPWDLHIFQFETMLPGKYLENILAIVTFSWVPREPSIDLTRGGGPFSAAERFPNSLGKHKQLTLFAISEKFLGTNFDIFAGFAYQKLKPGSRGANYRLAGIIPVEVKLADSDLSSRAWHIGFRYTIPYAPLNNPKFGYEYNQGSKHFFSGAFASEDPLNKLQLNGRCHDFYYIQPINKNLMLRAGLTYLIRDYPLLTKRAQENKRGYKETITNTYLLLDARF